MYKKILHRLIVTVNDESTRVDCANLANFVKNCKNYKPVKVNEILKFTNTYFIIGNQNHIC